MMKIGTFPTPHPDELLYSVIARHHMRVRGKNENPRDTLEQLFGSRTATATYDFPCRLQDLCDRLPDGLEFTPSTIIKERTLLPFYSPFLPPERLAAITSRLVQSDTCGSVHAMIGSINLSSNFSLTHLRYCPICLREDQEKYGEGYWHRSHQLPGIFICHEHNVPLLRSQVQIANRFNKLVFHALEQEYRHDDPSCPSSGEVSDCDLWLAKKSHWLLNGHARPPLGLDILKERYLNLLITNGLARPTGTIRQKEFLDRFTNFYGRQKLEEYCCDIGTKSRGCWLMSAVQKTKQALPPLRHLLLMKFLGVEPEEFLSDDFKALKPFGDGPYPCLNPVCSQHNKLVITELKIARNSHTGHPFGNFKCEKCGFAYGRTGPDTCPEDKFKRTIIINTGPVWNQELKRLNADATQNLKQKAIRLGVDPSTMRRHLAKLKGGNKTIVADQKNFEAKKTECRQILINVIRENPKITRSELRVEIVHEFGWLYRNDHDWLYENLPNPQKLLGQKSSFLFDWDRKDKEIAEKVNKAICDILNKDGKPQRVTLTRIGFKIGCTTSLKRNLDNLPETNAIIEQHLESKNDFQVRRVQAAAEGIIDKGNRVFRWELIQKAGLSSECKNLSPIVDKEINRQIGRSS